MSEEGCLNSAGKHFWLFLQLNVFYRVWQYQRQQTIGKPATLAITDPGISSGSVTTLILINDHFFFYQFIRRVLVTLSNPNSNWHHRALNNTTDYGYYWFGVTMEPSVSIPSCSGKHHSEQHPLLHSSSRDDPHRAWSIFRSTCSGRGRTKLDKEVVALRCVVEVVVEMKGEKGEIV